MREHPKTHLLRCSRRIQWITDEHLEFVEEVCRKQEQFHPCQRFAQALPEKWANLCYKADLLYHILFAQTKRNKFFNPLQSSLLIQKAFRQKPIWLRKNLLIVENTTDLRHNVCAFGQPHFAKPNIRCCSMCQIQRQQVANSLGFLRESCSFASFIPNSHLWRHSHTATWTGPSFELVLRHHNLALAWTCPIPLAFLPGLVDQATSKKPRNSMWCKLSLDRLKRGHSKGNASFLCCKKME